MWGLSVDERWDMSGSQADFEVAVWVIVASTSLEDTGVTRCGWRGLGSC